MGSSFRFCALVLAVSICGCASKGWPPPPPPPPPSHVVSLDVRAPNDPQPGYIDTTASNHQVYHYQYTVNGNTTGEVTVNSTEGNNVPIVINLKGTYRIGTVSFTNDTNLQLSHDPITHPKNALIHDKNNAKQRADYKVVVNDDSSGTLVTIPCDPRIVNN